MFIVIEHDGSAKWAAIVTNEEGENKTFLTKEEAQKEVDECQNGIIVELT